MNAKTQYRLSSPDLEAMLALTRTGTLALAGERLGLDASTVFRTLQRIAATVLLLALIPVWESVDALGAIGGATAVLSAIIVYESVRYAEARAEERAHLHEHGD